MSKQDRQGSRTVTDLERKYGFGQSFAEVYALANDARTAAEEAKNAADKAYENMTPEQIFHMLTKYGEKQGVFRGEDGNLYINAAYLYGKILSGQELEVDAATIKGTLSADCIDSSFMRVNSATVYDLKSNFVRILDLLGVYSARTDAYGNVVTDRDGNVQYDIAGLIGALDGTASDGSTLRGCALLDGTASNYIIATSGGARMSAGGASIYVYNSGAYAGAASTVDFTAPRFIGEWAGNSDRRLKNTIIYGLDEYEELFKKLKPCSFAFNKDTEGSRHWGLVAQDVLQSAEESELEKPIAFVADTGEYYGIAYGELAALNTHMIQKLMNRVDELEKKLAELTGGETNE